MIPENSDISEEGLPMLNAEEPVLALENIVYGLEEGHVLLKADLHALGVHDVPPEIVGVHEGKVGEPGKHLLRWQHTRVCGLAR